MHKGTPLINPHSRLGGFLTAICTIFSVFAVSFSASYLEGSTALVFDVNSMLQFAVAALAIYLFWRLFWKNPFAPSMTEAVIAAVFAILSTAGLLLDSVGTLTIDLIVLNDVHIGSSLAICAVLLAMTLGFFLFYYASIDWLYSKVSSIHLKPAKEGRTVTFFKHDLTLPVCAGIILIAWLPYIVYFFPFTVTTDTSAHLAQLLGDVELTTHFPYLPGLVESKLYQFGTMLEPSGTLGMFLMGIIQVILGVFVFAVIVLWIKRLRMPDWMVYGSLAFFALFPLIPVYMVQIGKDTIHAELVALFALQMMLFCLNRRKSTPRIKSSLIYSPWMIALVGLLVALTRNNGIFIAVIALAICLILYRDKLMAVASLVMCICFCAWQLAIVPACGVRSAGYTEACSMPAQITAACIANDAEMSDEERTQLQGFFDTDLSNIAELYNPYSSDPVKDNLSLPNLGDAVAFASMSLSFAAENPAVALSAALDTAYGAWYPFCRGTYHSEDTPYIIATTGDWMHIEQWYASADQQPDLAASKRVGMQAIAALHYIPVVSMFYTPGVYLWLIALILGFSIKTKSDRALAISVLSIFLGLWLIMLFGPCASLRYAIPAVFSLPILVTVVATSLLREEKEVVNEIQAC